MKQCRERVSLKTATKEEYSNVGHRLKCRSRSLSLEWSETPAMSSTKLRGIMESSSASCRTIQAPRKRKSFTGRHFLDQAYVSPNRRCSLDFSLFIGGLLCMLFFSRVEMQRFRSVVPFAFSFFRGVGRHSPPAPDHLYSVGEPR